MLSIIMTVVTVVMVVTVVGLGELALSVLFIFMDKTKLSTTLLVLNPLCLVAGILSLLYH